LTGGLILPAAARNIAFRDLNPKPCCLALPGVNAAPARAMAASY
jgi:hypothetical protein